MKPDEPAPQPDLGAEREAIGGRLRGPARLVLDDAARAVARARELERRVQEVAGRLQTPEEHAVAIVEAALETLGASVGVAVRRTSDGTALELLGAAHLPDDVREEYQRFPLDAPLPVAHVVRTGRAPVTASRNARSWTSFGDAVVASSPRGIRPRSYNRDQGSTALASSTADRAAPLPSSPGDTPSGSSSIITITPRGSWFPFPRSG